MPNGSPIPPVDTAPRRRRGLDPSVMAGAGAILVVALLGWAVLLRMVMDMAAGADLARFGPGMDMLAPLLGAPSLDPLGLALLESLCRPLIGAGAQPGGASLAWGLADWFVLLAMWAAMAVAMMLPTALPLVTALSEAAPERQRPAPLAMLAGYLVIWLAFALAASGLHWGLVAAAWLDRSMAAASGLFAGAALILAGLYQFSALKRDCVLRCQRPLEAFALGWRPHVDGAFAMGLRQGVLCLGCCGPLMGVMFAVGVMNVVWMAALTVLMATEKLLLTLRFTHLIGAVLCVLGVWSAVAAIAARLG